MKYFICLFSLSAFFTFAAYEKDHDFSGAITMPDEWPSTLMSQEIYWTPGKKDGETVNVHFRLPINLSFEIII